MKLHRLLLAIAAIGLANVFVTEVRAGDFQGRSGLPWFAYGYSGSLYGLGRLPVPPYYAIHPPVYYSLPQARSYGHSPFAHCGDYPQRKVERRILRNPHVEPMTLPKPVEPPAESTALTVRVIANPYYTAETGPASILAAQTP